MEFVQQERNFGDFLSNCTKTSGFTESDLSESGKWLYQMLREKSMGTSSETDISTAAGGRPDSSEETVKADTETSSPSNPSEETVTADADISYTSELTNSWEADGKTFYQYKFTISNHGESDCNGWQIEVPFEDNIAVQDGWNGSYAVEGNILYISPVEYNAVIPAGGSVSDIGVIISK